MPQEPTRLRCTTDDPQLWREGTDSDLNYPYPVGDLLTITNSTAGPSLDYYYFFYAWVAEPQPVECVSDRVGVTVTVAGTVGLDEAGASDWSIMPNPAVRGAELQMPGVALGTSQVVDAQGRAVHNGTWESPRGRPAGWCRARATDQGLEHKALVIE